MIGQIKGDISRKGLGWIIVNTGGVGYKLSILKELYETLSLGEEISLWTHLVVRENALDLYGFSEQEELSFFELLNSVSGIGPKTALSILDAASVPALRQAVVSGKTDPLTKVSGIGKKNADKIVLELKGKIGAEEGGKNVKEDDVEVFEALVALGYSDKESREIIKQIPENVEGTSARVRKALEVLG